MTFKEQSIPLRPAISQTLTMSSSFAQDLATWPRAGCQAMEVWLTKLEDHLRQTSLDETRRILQEQQIELAAAALHGNLCFTTGEAYHTSLADLQRRLSLCQALGIPVLIIALDEPAAVNVKTYDHARHRLCESAELASSFGVRLAVEFQGRSRWCNCLATALELVASCEHPCLGINLDVFHFYVGASKPEDLELLTAPLLFHVQLSDLAGDLRELASDRCRILPGEGDFRLRPIVEHLTKIGYMGYVSVEAPNPHFWEMKPEQVVEAATTGLRRLLGLASMPSRSR